MVYGTIAFGLLIFVIFSVVLGIYTHKSGYYYKFRTMTYRVIERDFSFIPKFFHSRSVAEINQLKLDIKFLDFEKLRYQRELALKTGRMHDSLEIKVPAELSLKGKSYKIELGLSGLMLDHIEDDEKWSFSVDVKKGKTIAGMKKFALLIPMSRGYLTDWIGFLLLKSRGIVGLRTDLVLLSLNGKNLGLYYLEERFDKLLIESNQLREGIVFKIVDNEIKTYGQSSIDKSEELTEQYLKLKQLWQGILLGKLEIGSFFDLKQLAATAAVCDLMNSKHGMSFDNMRFYFNPITLLAEPTPREWHMLQKEFNRPLGALLIEPPSAPDATLYHNALYQEGIPRKILNNLEFKKAYLKEMAVLSRKQYLDSLFEASQYQINQLLSKVYYDNPFYEFPYELLYSYQELIRNKLNPNRPYIELYLDTVFADTIVMFAENKTWFPIQISAVFSGKNKLKMNNECLIFPRDTLKKYQKIKIHIDTLLGSIDANKLKVNYGIVGFSDYQVTQRGAVFYNEYVPLPKKYMDEKELEELNFVHTTSNVDSFSFLQKNEENHTILLSKECVIKTTLVLPKGYKVIAQPGTKIIFQKNAKIISHSPLEFIGEKDNPITVISPDSSGQGIVIFNTTPETSTLQFVDFKYLSNVTDFGWQLRGAVTFYQSPVLIENCTFKKNIQGDDYLNIIRSDFEINNALFVDTKADAFDADFCKGKMTDVVFKNVGNDGIDVSGTHLTLDNIYINTVGDKAISSGENSDIVAHNVRIEKAEIALASKDNSTLNVDSLSAINNTLTFCAFQKKSEYGPGKISVSQLISERNVTEYLIEKKSSLFVEGREVEVESNEQVKKMLYGVKYGKASR